jgi:hypothetical protein
LNRPLVFRTDSCSSDNNYNNNINLRQQTRRDSSATITSAAELKNKLDLRTEDTDDSVDVAAVSDAIVDAASNEIENETKMPSVTSLSSSKINHSASSTSRHYQQQHSIRPNNSRLIDRRIQRRNMTDPLATQIALVCDEKHSVIMNQIIKRNSFNDSKTSSQPKQQQQQIQDNNQQQQQKEQEQQKQDNQLINLCGDSTSTIMSSDSGVSSNSCENNNANSAFSDEYISKSPLLLLPVSSSSSSSSGGTDEEHKNNNKQPKGASSLKATNSVLSTTSTISSSSSSSSSSNEPTNISYSSSFNSTGSSSTRIDKFNKNLIHNNKFSMIKTNNNNNILNDDDEEEDNENDIEDIEHAHLEHNIKDAKNLDEEDEDDDYVDLFEFSSSNPPVPPNYLRKNSFIDYDYNNAEVIPTARRTFTTIKARSNSINNESQPTYSGNLNYYKNASFSSSSSSSKNKSTHFDYNNNEADLTARYFDLINNNNLKNKFQQPKIPMNSSSAVSIQKHQQQYKKLMSKKNPTNVTNETVRINPNDLIVKNINNNNNNDKDMIDFDTSVLSGQMFANSNMDSHHRMILVKLLNTTMDAT